MTKKGFKREKTGFFLWFSKNFLFWGWGLCLAGFPKEPAKAPE